jgi:predicted transcriptional regulator
MKNMSARKSIEELTVGEVMTKDIISLDMDKGAADIVKTLDKKKVSGLVVTDFAGDVVGVVSAQDVFKLLEDGVFYDGGLTAEDLMTPFTIMTSPETPLIEAAMTMLERGIHRLIVTQSPSRKKPVGIISSTDIIREIAKTL